MENWTAWRRAVSRGGCLYAQAVLRAPVRDLTGGFKAFRADALHAIDYRTARAKGYAFQVELTYRALRAGLRVTELPIVFRERREGESKMSGAIALEAAWRVPALRLQFRARRCRSASGDEHGAAGSRPRLGGHARDAARLAAPPGSGGRRLGRRELGDRAHPARRDLDRRAR